MLLGLPPAFAVAIKGCVAGDGDGPTEGRTESWFIALGVFPNFQEGFLETVLSFMSVFEDGDAQGEELVGCCLVELGKSCGVLRGDPL